jgi:hypothetical protein
MNKEILLILAILVAFAGVCQAQGVGEKFWPYVEPPEGIDMNMDVAARRLTLLAAGVKDPYVITNRDKKTGKEEKYYAWADTIVWDDINEIATAENNIRLENNQYRIEARKIIYDRKAGTVISPDITVIIEKLPDGFTNFMKVRSAKLIVGDKGVEGVICDKVIEGRYHISGESTGDLLKNKNLLSEERITAPKPAPELPVQTAQPQPVNRGATLKTSEPEL